MVDDKEKINNPNIQKKKDENTKGIDYNREEKIKNPEKRCCINKGEKIWFNLSLVCRIIFTLLSLEALFFIYNMIIQDILIFPGILYDMENLMWIFFIFFISFLFVLHLN